MQLTHLDVTPVRRDQHTVEVNSLLPAPQRHLSLIVVIPCYNEPDLLSTLESLWACRRPTVTAEIIVVINGSDESNKEVIGENRRTCREMLEWAEHHIDAQLTFHLLYYPKLPRKEAGVGLARKLGMDLAQLRFSQIE